MKKIIFHFFLIAACGLYSCDFGNNESPCDDDENGRVGDNCVKVSVNDYTVQGTTTESMRISFRRGAETIHIRLTDLNSLIEETTYSFTDADANVTFGYSNGPTNSIDVLNVTIRDVSRSADGNSISGSFEFKGFSEANFQSFEFSRSGSFNEVAF